MVVVEERKVAKPVVSFFFFLALSCLERSRSGNADCIQGGSPDRFAAAPPWPNGV